jgi:hypothetical protein
VSGSRSGTPIGVIVGGVLGAVLLVAIMVVLMIFWWRRKTRRQKALERVQVQQPFYSDMTQSSDVVHPGGASLSNNESSFHNAHAHHPRRAGGTFTKHIPPENGNLPSDITSSTPGFSHYQISSNATSHSRGPQSISGSEATLPSAQGSVASLLPPETAPLQHVQHLAESSSQVHTANYTPESSTHHGRVVNHEDSGYRTRPAGSSQALGGAVIEFPPAYTSS